MTNNAHGVLLTVAYDGTAFSGWATQRDARTVEDALEIKNTDIVKELSLPPVKIHCSVLAEDAIRAAIGDWKKKNGVAEAAPATAAAAQ